MNNLIQIFKRLLHLLLTFLTETSIVSESLILTDINVAELMIPTNTTSFCNSLDVLSVSELLSFRVTSPEKIHNNNVNRTL